MENHVSATSEQVRAAMQRQRCLLDEMYQVITRVGGYTAAQTHPDGIAARQAYDGSVEELTALLGADAPCHDVDTELWSSYSDAFKERAGFRPRQPMSRAQVQAYFEDRRSARLRGEYTLTYECPGFTDDKSIADASCSQESAQRINAAIAADGGFPPNVLAVESGYITQDDEQGSRDIRVFASVTLHVKVSAEQSPEDIAIPEAVLSRVTDLMGCNSDGNNVLELEEHAWEVVEYEEASFDSADQG